jgi:protoporphyrinogen/coproporphyrinogen III oxidase
MNAIVLGAGISGLTAAYRLASAGVNVTVLEAQPRVGGLLGTERFGGFEVELGPDSILSEKPWALELARELGLSDQIIATRPDAHGAYIVHRGKLERVPEGFSMMAPTDLGAMFATPILSPLGKLRTLLDMLIPRRPPEGDESLEDFVVRRLGRESFERLAQPLVGGIYGADPARLSLKSTMPRFIELEQRHGSVIRGLYAKKKSAGASERASGARYGMFAAFRGGMQTLIDALEQRLGERVRLNHAVKSVSRSERGYVVSTSHGVFEAEALVVAIPAHAASHVLERFDPELARALGAIEYASAATVTCIWDRAQVPHSLDAYGFVVPAAEKREILAATWASAKWPGRAPESKVLIRVFIGGYTGQHLVEKSDAALLEIVARELGELMGIEAAPEWTRVMRYVRAMPQYHVGHTSRVAAIDGLVQPHARLVLAGNAYRGVGIPDAVKSGEDAAARVLGQLGESVPSPAA